MGFVVEWSKFQLPHIRMAIIRDEWAFKWILYTSNFQEKLYLVCQGRKPSKKNIIINVGQTEYFEHLAFYFMILSGFLSYHIGDAITLTMRRWWKKEEKKNMKMVHCCRPISFILLSDYFLFIFGWCSHYAQISHWINNSVPLNLQAIHNSTPNSSFA